MANYRGGYSEAIIHSGTTSAATGTTVDVRDFRHVSIYIATASSANLTIKCQGSLAREEPNFGLAASSSNVWDYIAMYDLQDAAKTDGDTGIAFTGTDDVRQFIVNVDNLKWLNFTVTAYSAGSVDVGVFLSVN